MLSVLEWRSRVANGAPSSGSCRSACVVVLFVDGENYPDLSPIRARADMLRRSIPSPYPSLHDSSGFKMFLSAVREESHSQFCKQHLTKAYPFPYLELVRDGQSKASFRLFSVQNSTTAAAVVLVWLLRTSLWVLVSRRTVCTGPPVGSGSDFQTRWRQV